MWTFGIFCLVLTTSIFGFHIKTNEEYLSIPEIVEQINNDESSLWKADYNFDPSTPISSLKILAGTLPLDESNPEHKEFIEQINEIQHNSDEEEDDDEKDIETMGCKNLKALNLPRNFDAREKWPECSSIGHIVDQSMCGSCWAVSVASSISDRLCIASNGYFKGKISATDVVSCTAGPASNGCLGGWPQLAWKHFGHQGFVTGGDYNSGEGCQPYFLPPCSHHTTGPYANCSTLGKPKAPACSKSCTNPSFGATFNFDLKKGKKASMISRCNAMKQIYEHGPLVAIFAVFEDFLLYKSGIYQHNVGNKVGLHAVKVIGWGIENNIPYWLVANSWNKYWGDKGTFKILRGENEGNFEMGFNVGYPDFVKL